MDATTVQETAPSGRLDLTIDVFEEKGQRAWPLAELTPAELIAAILEEFRELEYLSDDPADYLLRKRADGEALEEEAQIRHQLLGGDGDLVLVEREQPLPRRAQRPSRPIYLRELSSGRVYKLDWIPAIIGRPDAKQPHDDWVAVNLEMYKMGLRVSRRHAQITEQNGRFFVQSMSRNPTTLKTGEETRPVMPEPQMLHNGDLIQLDRSDITLKFIIRPDSTQGDTEA